MGIVIEFPNKPKPKTDAEECQVQRRSLFREAIEARYYASRTQREHEKGEASLSEVVEARERKARSEKAVVAAGVAYGRRRRQQIDEG